MLKWLSPGDLICDAVGLSEQDEHRQILRMFMNIIIWGAVATVLAFYIAL